MKNRYLKLKVLFFASLLFPAFGFAQTGPCYIFSYSTGNTYTPLSTDSIPLYNDNSISTRDEGLSANIPIGFTFIYNFQPYDTFKVSTDGFVTLDKNLQFDYFDINNLNSSLRKLILAPLWDDLVIQPGGSIRYDLTGSVGSRILKIEFNKLSFYLGGGFNLKFQVWLYEGINEIEFRYGDDGSAIGWRNYSDQGINIGLNDERNNSFMNIIPSTVEASGPAPFESLTNDAEFYYLGMENDVPPGLVYKFTPTTRWQGTTNTDWTTISNWELNNIPGSSDNASIPSGKSKYPIITASGAACDNLFVEAGGELTITNGGELTVSGNLVNNGNVAVTSTSEASTGSLIVDGTSDAIITFERYLTGDPKWHLVSSPVSGQDIWSWATLTENNISTNSSKYAITNYDEGIDNWNAYPTSDPGSDFVVGKGYSTLRGTNGIISFSGTINTADKNNIPISKADQGWNLLGNPFTSAIRATSAAGSDYLLSTENVANLDQSYAGLYLWDPASNEYVIINNAGGSPTGTLTQNYIQAGQGFFVRAKDNSSRVFDITRAMQMHQPTIPFKSGEGLWPTIKLMAASGANKSSTLVSFNSGMTTGLDVTYDAGMFKSNPDLALYTKLVDDNGVDFSIQCLPNNNSNFIIPVGINVATGTEVTFSADLFNLPEDFHPYLEDRITGNFISLKSGKVYTVLINENYKNNEALFLHTNNNEITESKYYKTDDSYKIIANHKDGYIRIISSDEKSSVAEVLDISGRIVAIREINAGSDNLIYISGTPGIYIIHIKNEYHRFSQKLFWK